MMNDHETDPLEVGAEPLDRVDELMSLFFDDGLSEDQITELNETLLSDPAARARCFDTAQLHADLQTYFRPVEDTSDSRIAPPLAGLPTGGLTGGAPTA